MSIADVFADGVSAAAFLDISLWICEVHSLGGSFCLTSQIHANTNLAVTSAPMTHTTFLRHRPVFNKDLLESFQIFFEYGSL